MSYIKIHLRSSDQAKAFAMMNYTAIKNASFVDFSNLCEPTNLFDEEQWELKGHILLKKRLEEVLDKLKHNYPDFKFPVSSIERRPGSKLQGAVDLKDFTDSRGHWTGLSIDISPRVVIETMSYNKFVSIMHKTGLIRPYTRNTKPETWHFSLPFTDIKNWYQKEYVL